MLQLWNFIYPNSSNSESYSAKKARLVTAMSTSPHPEPLAPYLDFTKNITILDLTDATGQCFRYLGHLNSFLALLCYKQFTYYGNMPLFLERLSNCVFWINIWIRLTARESCCCS